MTPIVLKLLSKAAKERRRAAIRYEGQRHLRVVEPHVIYLDDEGNVVADCYQVKGQSSSGKAPPFWKTIRITKIDAVFLLSTPFEAEIVEGFGLNRASHAPGLIAAAYDRPPSLPQRARDQESKTLAGQGRGWWSQFESVIDGFLSDESSARQ
jgi:hypothetical protein